MRQCEVYILGIRAGLLTEDDNGEYTFAYDQAYRLRKNPPPVSLTMPVREAPYHSPYLFPYFFNMLSEGENRQIQSRLHHLDPEDDFGILLATAQFDVAGAVTVKPIQP